MFHRDFADAVADELLILRECSLAHFFGNLSAFERERRSQIKYTIGLLDAITLNASVRLFCYSTLNPVSLLCLYLKCTNPQTTLHFNPTSTLLISIRKAADNSICIVAVPDSIGGQCEFVFPALISQTCGIFNSILGTYIYHCSSFWSLSWQSWYSSPKPQNCRS
jgi:hypothetical protein